MDDRDSAQSIGVFLTLESSAAKTSSTLAQPPLITLFTTTRDKMDCHYVEGATKSGVTQAHNKDLAIQEKYPVKCLTYWFDEPRYTGFCLIESPDKETIQKAHDEAHGLVASEIIEVDTRLVEAFLGRVKDPTPVDIS